MTTWDGILKSQAEIDALPIDTPAWLAVKKAADTTAIGPTSISDQNSNNNVFILAKAIVFARTGDGKYLTPVIQAINDIVAAGPPSTTRALGLGRELLAYVLAAEFIGLGKTDSALNTKFKAKLTHLLHEFQTKGGGPLTLEESSNKRPNNWGTHATATRIAIDMYTGDLTDLDKAAKIFQGWLGDRSAYAGFTFGDLWWQADPAHPVGINPKGAMIDNHIVDGAQPEELRRQGSKFTWPPPSGGDAEMYSFEALQGAMVAGLMLTRAGYPAFDWSDEALYRAFSWLYDIAGWKAQGDDGWMPFVVNYAYGTDFPADVNARPGKNFGWAQWLYPTGSTLPDNGGGGTGGGDNGGGGGGTPTDADRIKNALAILQQVDFAGLKDSLVVLGQAVDLMQKEVEQLQTNIASAMKELGG